MKQLNLFQTEHAENLLHYMLILPKYFLRDVVSESAGW